MGSRGDLTLNFDPQFIDPQALRKLSRRGFLGCLLGGGAALAFSSNAFAASPRTQSRLERGAAPDDERYWELVASEFVLRRNISYMNTGTRGPSPRCVHMAQLDALNGVNADYFDFSKTGCNKDFIGSLRAKLAAFVGAKPSEIAFTSNTTEGMVFGTLGVDLKPGDEIAFTNHDHPSGGNPIMLRAAREGLSVRVIDLADRKFHPPKSPDEVVKAFEAVLTPKTKLLSLRDAGERDLRDGASQRRDHAGRRRPTAGYDETRSARSGV